MTVAELIKELEKWPAGVQVVTYSTFDYSYVPPTVEYNEDSKVVVVGD